MKISSLFFGLAIFSMVVVGMWGTAGHIADNYGVTTSEDLDSLSQLEDLEDEMDGAMNFTGTPFELLAGIPFFTAAVAGIQMFQTILSISDSVITLIATLGGMLPIPTFITSGITVMMWTFLAFTFLNALFNRDV
jgi:hypothetical protein